MFNREPVQFSQNQAYVVIILGSSKDSRAEYHQHNFPVFPDDIS